MTAPDFNVARGKLNGLYLTEDQNSQTDLLLLLNDPSISSGFISTYLRALLQSQAQTLAYCAALAVQLAQALTPVPAEPGAASPPQAKPTSYTLAEARRGLREADAILRQAVASIGGLEAGFETILGRGKPEIPQPAQPAALLTPAILDEGQARETLLEAGRVCADIAPELNATAAALQKTLAAAAGLTPEHYRQNYNAAVTTAQTCYQLLLDVLARLRLEIAAKELPLVAWRVHDQVQSLAERLRWGVLRG
jgi:hypothetical protein